MGQQQQCKCYGFEQKQDHNLHIFVVITYFSGKSPGKRANSDTLPNVKESLNIK